MVYPGLTCVSVSAFHRTGTTVRQVSDDGGRHRKSATFPDSCLLNNSLSFRNLMTFPSFYYNVSITTYPSYTPCPCNYHTFVYVHESFSCLLYPLTFPLQLSACSLSMSLSLFCLLGQFVHQTPHTCEIVWHLSCSDWLISAQISPGPSILSQKLKFSSFMVEQYSTV